MTGLTPVADAAAVRPLAATADGGRSTTVSVNAQITPEKDPGTFALLRSIFSMAVCAATAV